MSVISPLPHRLEAVASDHLDREPFGMPPLDADMVAKIREIGFHPFLLIRFESAPGAHDRHLVCNTQNETSQFLEQVMGSAELTNCGLIRGLERALRLEIYEAAESWFSWVRGAPKGPLETVHLGAAAGMKLPQYYGYPVFRVAPPDDKATDTAERRRATLIAMFQAYTGTNGNDATRHRLAEALALAVSRCLGAIGDYNAALSIVDRALTLWRSSIHLKTAKHALGLKLDGKMVPDRMVKFIGEDNGYLKQFICPLPFEHFEISHSGNVLVCCGHWLPTSIGNFLKDPVDKIRNSETAQKISSVHDRRLV